MRLPEHLRWTLGIALAALLLLASGLGERDLWAPDEPRYTQIAEELRSFRHGPEGLVLLHLNDDVYTQKPPLYFWLAAIAGTPLGRVTEGAARLPSVLAGIATVLLTLRFGTTLAGRATGVLGAGLLLTVFEFAHVSRRVQLDVLLTLFETLALLAFWRLDRGDGRRWVQLTLFHAALGAAVLTKGPVGFLVPLLVIATYLAWEKRLREFRRLVPLQGLLLSLGPGLLWVAGAAALAPQGYLDEAVGVNVFGRFFSGTSHERPIYYFLYQFPIDFLPWTLLLPAVVGVARARIFSKGTPPADTRTWRFLLAWVLVTLVFFSLSSGKRGLYLVPAFPAAALLCADAMRRILEGRRALPRGYTIGAAAVGILLGSAAVVWLVAPVVPESDLVPSLRLAAGLSLLVVLAASVAAWVVLSRRDVSLAPRVALPLLAVFGIELCVFNLLYPALDPGKSPRAISRAVAALTKPDEPVGLLSDRAFLGGLVYYGNRRVIQLSTPETVERFFADGGHVIVVKARKVKRIESVRPVEVVATSRSGRRTLWVVTDRLQDPLSSLPAGGNSQAVVLRPEVPRERAF